jgi:hypothetical protein
MRWRLNDPPGDELGESESDEMDVRGLIWGVWSDGRRRDGVLKLKLMLKISLGCSGLRSFDVHRAGSLVFFGLDSPFDMLSGLESLGIVEICGTASMKNCWTKLNCGLPPAASSGEGCGLPASGVRGDTLSFCAFAFGAECCDVEGEVLLLGHDELFLSAWNKPSRATVRPSQGGV